MEFPKMARLNRDVVVTEKIDGTNAQINIVSRAECGLDVATSVFHNADFVIYAGSRSRWIQPGKQTDNAGFAAWVRDNGEELLKLGLGRHFGEWWGASIQRRYGLDHKRFSLFNVGRWEMLDTTGQAPGIVEVVSRTVEDGLERTVRGADGPACCHVVPTIWRGNFRDFNQYRSVEVLRGHGSFAAPGFMNPEGVVIYHEASKKCFKVTLENDESPKSLVK